VLLHSLDAHTGEALPYAFHQATGDEVEAAAQAAEVAYPSYRSTRPDQRAAFSTRSPANWTRWVMTSSRT
jgi:NADP-dependent aldehyde dehydrogenase